jgi:ABC-type multidrug transport system permease subunit
MDEKKNQDEQKVVVTDIRMPFWSMVLFMVKWVFASIPAMFIFSVVVGLILAVLSFIFGSMWGFHGLFREGGLPM